jgi:hypothetical protein
MNGDGGTLVLKVRGTRAGDAVYVLSDDGLERIPDFGELVTRERDNPTLHTDERVRLAERLGGAARRCSCGREIRVLQKCECGRIGAPTDRPYLLSESELEHAEKAYATVVRAWRLIVALKKTGHVVPSGPTQLLATADLLTRGAKPPALLAAWKATGMNVDVDKTTLTRELDKLTSS